MQGMGFPSSHAGSDTRGQHVRVACQALNLIPRSQFTQCIDNRHSFTPISSPWPVSDSRRAPSLPKSRSLVVPVTHALRVHARIFPPPESPTLACRRSDAGEQGSILPADEVSTLELRANDLVPHKTVPTHSEATVTGFKSMQKRAR